MDEARYRKELDYRLGGIEMFLQVVAKWSINRPTLQDILKDARKLHLERTIATPLPGLAPAEALIHYVRLLEETLEVHPGR